MPAVKKAKANKPKISESQLQASFFKWFRLQYPQFYFNCFAIPNGGLRNKIVAAKLKREGATSGVWDVFLSVPNRGQNGMWIEFKVGYNKLTENQQDFKDAQFTGYRFEVCHTLDEAVKAVKSYFSM